MLLLSFSGTLLVVSILVAVYGGLLMVPVGAMGHFWGGMALSRLWEVLWAVFKDESLRRACPAFEFDLAGKLQRHFTCGLDFRHSL